VFLTVTVLAGGHRFKLLKPGQVNGVDLKVGQYELVLDGQGLGEIYLGKKLVVEAQVEVLPIGSALKQSVSQNRDGKIREIRLKNERVVFVDSAAGAQSAQ
jgi:hypothetical protein